MATRIRLKRVGRKKRPFYRIVIADQRTPRDGRTVEEIGYYDPKAAPPVIEVNGARALAWLQKGAQPSATARSLLRASGVLQQFDAIRKARQLAAEPRKAETEETEPEAEAREGEADAEHEEPQT